MSFRLLFAGPDGPAELALHGCGSGICTCPHTQGATRKIEKALWGSSRAAPLDKDQDNEGGGNDEGLDRVTVEPFLCPGGRVRRIRDSNC